MVSRIFPHKKWTFISFFLFCAAGIQAQEVLQTVTAQDGDGIFSMLRNEGIEIRKYYAQFLELNTEKIKNGSQLIVGEQYLIPNAPDSFKNMGTSIKLPSGKETPIFEGQFASLKRKDSSLQNTVYYLVTNNNGRKGRSKEAYNEIAERMARKLIQRKARVYLLNNYQNDSLNLIDLVSLVNKRYLRHNGDYQRLLVLKTNELSAKSKTDVTVYHYAESKEGKKMAGNILHMLGRNTIKHKDIEKYSETFTKFADVSFAKNLLPTVTFIEMGPKPLDSKKSLKVSSDRKNIADLLTNGILSDYSKLEFQDNE